jgi:hypothetical protein
MLADLESMHECIINAYKGLLLLSGIDLDFTDPAPMPTRHLPI